jgi:hypothetical protein
MVENGKGEKMKQKQKMAMGVAHTWIQIWRWQKKQWKKASCGWK